MSKSLLLAIAFLAICHSDSANGANEAAGNEQDVLYVSIVDMIVRPEKLPKGRDRIAVVGFLDKGGSALYLTEGYAKFGDAAALPMATPSDGFLPEQCTNRYVRVTGIWRRGPWNRRGFSSIEKVEIIGEDEVIRDEPSGNEMTLMAAPVACWDAEPDSE